MLFLLGHAVILALWWLLMRARGRAEAEHRAAMDDFLATARALEAEHAARNAEVIRAIRGFEAARALPTHQPDARPS